LVRDYSNQTLLLLSLEKKCSLLFSLLLFLLTGYVAFGQNMVFDRITRLDGLPSNNISDIVQDDQGFMWFGTRNGLIRFDGYSYKKYTYNPLDTFTVSDNYISCLLKLKDGRILVGTNFAGFSIYDSQLERFSRYQFKIAKTNPQSNNILSASQDSEGYVWLGTWNGFTKFDPKTGFTKHFSVPRENAKFSGPNYVSSIVPTSDGKLWLYSPGNRVSKFDPISEKFEFLPFAENINDQILLNKGGVLLLDKLDNLWIGTEFDGVFKFDQKNKKIQKYSILNKKTSSNVITDIYQDEAGEIWLGTLDGGLGKYSREEDRFHTYRTDISDNKSISSDRINCVFETKPGIIWIGTHSGGISVYKKQKQYFNSFTNKRYNSNNPNIKSVLSFEQAPNGKVWIGTDGGGIDLFDPQTGTLQNFNSNDKQICFDIIKSLYVDNEHNLWMGSYGSGVCRKGNSGAQSFYPSLKDDKTYLSKPSVWSICGDDFGNIWFGMMDDALDIYNPKDGTFRHIVGGGKENLPMGAIHVVFKDSKGRMWVGSETNGVALYDHKKDTFIHFDTEHATGLKSNSINEIKEFDGKIWLGLNNGGVSRLEDESKKIFNTYTTAHGLAGNSVFGIERDDRDHLWLSTEVGISRLDATTGQIRNFDVYDGIGSNEFTYGASFRSDQGLLYFGSADGFVTFYPDSVQFNELAPQISILSVKIANQEIKRGQDHNGKVYFDVPLHQLKELNLTHDDYMISFDFAAHEYSAPLKGQYAYILEGFDKEWVFANANQRSATYTNLPSGDYVFRLKASNNHGKWNENGISINLHVIPPWWETKLFKIIVFVVAALLVFLMLYIRTRYEQNKRKYLEEIVSQRTAELNSKNKELHDSNTTKDKLFSILSHDLRGPANSIEALSSMVLKHFTRFSEEDKFEAVGQLNKAAKSLASLVSTMFTWARLHNHSLSPVSSLVLLEEVINKAVDLLDLQAKGKDLQISVKYTEPELYVYADKDMIETVIRNLLANAIKFTENGGYIQVSTSTEEDMVKISVSDNGVGMDAATLKALNDGGKSRPGTIGEIGSGLGLLVCKDFAEANGGFMKVESKVNEGSTFEIFLPKNPHSIL
jgi:signal transduction histidine kinase/ligand-binding sensor domain-containing protein